MTNKQSYYPSYRVSYCSEHSRKKGVTGEFITAGYYRSNPFGHEDCSRCLVEPVSEIEKLKNKIKELQSKVAEEIVIDGVRYVKKEQPII